MIKVLSNCEKEAFIVEITVNVGWKVNTFSKTSNFRTSSHPQETSFWNMRTKHLRQQLKAKRDEITQKVSYFLS